MSAPALLSISATARAIGFDKATLYRIMPEHELFRPFITESPVKGLRCFKRYHSRQIDFIIAVLSGGMPVEEAWVRWQICRADILQARSCTTGAA